MCEYSELERVVCNDELIICDELVISNYELAKLTIMIRSLRSIIACTSLNIQGNMSDGIYLVSYCLLFLLLPLLLFQLSIFGSWRYLIAVHVFLGINIKRSTGKYRTTESIQFSEAPETTHMCRIETAPLLVPQPDLV